MDQLRQVLANIQSQLGRMKGMHRAVIVLVLVVFALLMFVVVQVSARSGATVEVLPGVAGGGEQQQALTHLVGAGFDAKLKNSRVVVPTDQVAAARAALAEAQLLPNDKSILFENILKQQSWTNTRQQNEALFKNALENELARTIERFSGVHSAKVLIDAPEPSGFGQAVRQPTASVAVTTASGRPLAQAQVDAIASLVAGSKAGLRLESIRVIDTVGGYQRRATSDEQVLPTTYLEHAARVEQVTREKIEQLLSYIPGVIVAVTAQVDVTRVESKSINYLPNKAGTVQLESTVETQSTTQVDAKPGAVPGVQANQTADITRGAGTGSQSGSETTTTEYASQFGSKQEVVSDPRGFPTQVAVSINVPRSFVVRAMSPPAKDGEEVKAPDDAAVTDAFEKRYKPAILESVLPQVRTLTAQASKGLTDEQVTKMVAQSVGISLMPLDLPVPTVQSAGLLGGFAGGGGGGLLSVSGGIIDKAVLGVLTVAALGMMFMLVRKSSKKVETPTAEELVGLPPTIEGGSDVVGEADETESAMPGIEVGDVEMESQKKLEQVGQMVTQNSEVVARMLNRWIEVEP